MREYEPVAPPDYTRTQTQAHTPERDLFPALSTDSAGVGALARASCSSAARDMGKAAMLRPTGAYAWRHSMPMRLDGATLSIWLLLGRPMPSG